MIDKDICAYFPAIARAFPLFLPRAASFLCQGGEVLKETI